MREVASKAYKKRYCICVVLGFGRRAPELLQHFFEQLHDLRWCKWQLLGALGLPILHLSRKGPKNRMGVVFPVRF